MLDGSSSRYAKTTIPSIRKGAYESDDEQDWSDEDGEDGDEETNGDQEADIEDRGSDTDAEDENQQSERIPHPHDGRLISKFDGDEPRLAQQITDLSIGFEDENWADTVVTGVTGWMLAKFTSLKVLAIGVRMFFGPDPKTGEKFGYEECPPTVEGTAPWSDETDLPRLIDSLPETLQKLELLIDFSAEWRSGARGYHPRHWTHLLDGFTAESRAQRLPNLTRFVIRERCTIAANYQSYQRFGTEKVAQLPVDEMTVQGKMAAEAAGAEYDYDADACMTWRKKFSEREHVRVLHQCGYQGPCSRRQFEQERKT